MCDTIYMYDQNGLKSVIYFMNWYSILRVYQLFVTADFIIYDPVMNPGFHSMILLAVSRKFDYMKRVQISWFIYI